MTARSAASIVGQALSSMMTGLAPDPVPAAPTPAPAPAAPTTPVVFRRPNGQDYYARLLDPQTGLHDVELLRRARGKTLAENQYVLLAGPAGVGKTAAVDAAFSGDLLTVAGDLDTDTGAFLGTWVQNPDGTYAWLDGPLVVAMEEGRVLFVDEVALINPSVMSVVYSAMDGRGFVRVTPNPARGVVHARPGFFVVGACNPDAPGARMSEALLRRFSVHVEATTDLDLAASIVGDSKVHENLITVAKNLEGDRRRGVVGWAPQMAHLLAFADLEARFGTTVALQNLVGVAPAEDRATVADVVSRVFGSPVGNLRQGRQALT